MQTSFPSTSAPQESSSAVAAADAPRAELSAHVWRNIAQRLPEVADYVRLMATTKPIADALAEPQAIGGFLRRIGMSAGYVATLQADHRLPALCRLGLAEYNLRRGRCSVRQIGQWRVLLPSGSPDGKRVLALSDDCAARSRNLAEPDRQPTILQGYTKLGNLASFSPDGTHVVAASENCTASVWNLADPDGQPTVLQGHTEVVNSVSFSPDGKQVVTASYDRTACVWDLAEPDGKPKVLEGHRGVVFSASFSPDGKRVVTTSLDGRTRLWDLAKPQQPMILKMFGICHGSASFSADGTRVVTVSTVHETHVWDFGEDLASPHARRWWHEELMTEARG